MQWARFFEKGLNGPGEPNSSRKCFKEDAFGSFNIFTFFLEYERIFL